MGDKQKKLDAACTLFALKINNLRYRIVAEACVTIQKIRFFIFQSLEY